MLRKIRNFSQWLMAGNFAINSYEFECLSMAQQLLKLIKLQFPFLNGNNDTYLWGCVRTKLDKVDKTLSTVEMLNKCSASHPGKSLGYPRQDGIFTTEINP